MASQEAAAEAETLLGKSKGAFFEGEAIISKKISELMTAQKAAKQARDDIKKELRNERRKKQRIMSKAKGLSNSDLVNILAERNTKPDKSVSPSPAEAEGGAVASGSGSGSASASSG